MLLIRNIFQIRAGSMKQALEVMKRGDALMKKGPFPRSRALTDVAADFYTLVLETEVESLAEFEKGTAETFANPEWQAWYQQFTPLIQSGRREIFRIVE